MTRATLDANEAIRNLHGIAFMIDSVQQSLSGSVPTNNDDSWALFMLANQIRDNAEILEGVINNGS